LRAVVPPPADAATRARLDEVRRQVARARALEGAGKYREGIALAEPLARELAALHYRPLEAELALQLGQLQWKASDLKTAARMLRDAAFGAEATRQGELLARACIALVNVERERVKYEAAHDWERHAQAALDASGRNDELESWLLSSVGRLL